MNILDWLLNKLADFFEKKDPSRNRASDLKFHFDAYFCLFIEDKNSHCVFFMNEEKTEELIKTLQKRLKKK